MKISLLLVCCLWANGTLQAQSPHWQFDPYIWQYDMTAYVTLSLYGKPVSQLSDYEIAAFCGDECRGVATIQIAEKDVKTTTYGYLRIRSNQQQGETITFCVYDRQKEKETVIEGTALTFKSQDVVGLPSNPLSLIISKVKLGDVNGDGDVDIADAVYIVNYVVGKPTPDFNEAAADVNNDGDIDIADAVQIVNFVVGKINAL